MPVAVADVMEPGPADRIRLVGVLELVGVIRQEGFVPALAGVGKEEPILLAGPAELVHVVDLVAKTQEMAQRLEDGLRDVLVAEDLHPARVATRTADRHRVRARRPRPHRSETHPVARALALYPTRSFPHQRIELASAPNCPGAS